MPAYEPEFYSQSDEDHEGPIRCRCRHIFTAGRRCGSPCLRDEQFCYYHHTTRKPIGNLKDRKNRTDCFDLPNPEDRDAIRAAVAQIMHAIAHNAIDMKRAGMLLYSLQISLCALPPQPRPLPLPAAKSNPVKDMVEETVLDDNHGVIAPEAEYEEPEEFKPRKTLARQLMDQVEAYEAKQAAEAANEAREAREKFDREQQAAQAEERRCAARKAFTAAGIDPEAMSSSRSTTIPNLDASVDICRQPRMRASHRPRCARAPRRLLRTPAKPLATLHPKGGSRSKTLPGTSPLQPRTQSTPIFSTPHTSSITGTSFPANMSSNRLGRGKIVPVYTYSLCSMFEHSRTSNSTKRGRSPDG